MPTLHAQAQLEHWRWLGNQIRCALRPDDARLILQYLAAARQIGASKDSSLTTWDTTSHALELLLDTAADEVLPETWRIQCLELAQLPLVELRQLACSATEKARSAQLAERHAGQHIRPAPRFDD